VSIEAHAGAALGSPAVRAEVAFVGVAPLGVLRFGPSADGVFHYVTDGMSRQATTGPPTELVLAVRAPVDGVLRALAVLAAMPVVEGVEVRPGSSYELGEPLWPGARFTAVLITDPQLPPLGAVEFLGTVPITANEQALKRAKGPAELHARWAEHHIDVRETTRRDAAIPAPDTAD
jgi:hypothetical protein